MSCTPLPPTQTAIVQDSDGRATVTHDAPVPQLRAATVLVKTAAVALNPSDFKFAKAFPSPGSVMGMDFAGHVVAMHADAARVRPDLGVGVAVCGVVHGSNPDDHELGSFAEYVLAPADLLFRVPRGMSLAQASTLGVALLTSCLALWGSLRLPYDAPASGSDSDQGRRPVLVYGGSTAMGTMAIQLLTIFGSDAVAVCSRANFDLVLSYGAGAVFDVTSASAAADIKTHTRGRLRHALDCIADKTSAECCYSALGRPGGRYAALEVVPEGWRTRQVVKYDLVMSLEGFGRPLVLGGEYGRPASAEKRMLAVTMFKRFQALLDEGAIKPHALELAGNGFDAVLEGLERLKTGSVSARKLVVSLASGR